MAMTAGSQLVNDYASVDCGVEKVYLAGAVVREHLGQVSEIRLNVFLAEGTDITDDVLGKRITVTVKDVDDVESKYTGICISIESQGLSDGFETLTLELRSWAWMLTQASDNRIFQNKTTPDIVKAVCEKMGFTDLQLKLSGTYPVREYCVQYEETNWQFVTRLLEEEGIYFYFDYAGAIEKLILIDAIGSHPAVSPDYVYDPRIGDKALEGHDILEWKEKNRVVTGKVTLVDLDMEKPAADLKVTTAIPKGQHGHKNYESYLSTARYKTAARGEALSRIRAEQLAGTAMRYVGSTNSHKMRCGSKFKLTGHPRVDGQTEQLVIATTAWIKVDDKLAAAAGYPEKSDVTKRYAGLDLPEFAGTFRQAFEAGPQSDPFRPPITRPMLRLDGLYRAVVTGPSGEEIYTDAYGRIKVFFPWDREGEKTDKSSCWVRVALPWTGKGYGMMVIPRIGQEVIIQFERGDPDYPICTGMIYNATNTTPEALPGSMNKTGIKTESTKGGGGFHEITMDDTKDSEMFRLQSEKDYNEIIKNNATITIGMEKKDPGDLTQTIYHTFTEKIKTGDYDFDIETGNRIAHIKTDDTLTVEGKSTTTITGDTKQTIKTGNYTEVVQTGNYARTVTKGNDTTTISKGNFALTVSKGNFAQTISKGNHAVTVSKGNTATTISKGNAAMTVAKGDMTTKVNKGKSLTEVSADMITKVKKGDHKTTVAKGKLAVTVSTGNEIHNVSKGNFQVSAAGGAVTISAAKKLTLKVGASKIEMKPAQIAINGTQVNVKGTKVAIQANAMAEFKGNITTVKAGGILTVKGSLTKIN